MDIVTQTKVLLAAIDAGTMGIPKVQASEANLQSALNTIYLWSGTVAVIAIIIAGFFYVTSTGEPAKVKRAKDTILYAAVGLVIIMMAFFITGLVIGGTSA